MAFYLWDDGTLDTVVVCVACDQEARYNWDGEHASDCTLIANGDCDCYGRFVDWVLSDAFDEHECESC